jgi:UDP-glucose 4-epimerase
MLGSAVNRQLELFNHQIFKCSEVIKWNNPIQLKKQISKIAANFFACLTQGDEWEIYWTAGVGSMSSQDCDFNAEIVALEALLEYLSANLLQNGTSGSIAYASSAGAIYAECRDFHITEESNSSAKNPYSINKLYLEQKLINLTLNNDKVKVFIGRFSTLFGPGQSTEKKQGFLSHIARCSLRNKTVEIFVPLDTSRDYIFIDDAASDFISALGELSHSDKKYSTKIISSENSITISSIISIFERLSKKRLRVIHKRNNLTGLYLPRVSYRSLYPKYLGITKLHNSFLEGASILFQFEKSAYLSGGSGGSPVDEKE